MRYRDSLTFMFSRPDWFSGLVQGTLCMFLPTIGYMVYGGYCCEMFEALLHDPKHKNHSPFQFGRFTRFLIRGIWPSLLGILLQTIQIALTILAVVGAMVVSSIAGGSTIAVVLACIIAGVFYFVAFLVLGFLTWPMSLYLTIRQEFDFSNMLNFNRDFRRRVFKEMLLAICFLNAVNLLLTALVSWTCCIGVWAAYVYTMQAGAHLECQLYELYLQRGGTPVPEKPPLVVKAEPPVTFE